MHCPKHRLTALVVDVTTLSYASSSDLLAQLRRCLNAASNPVYDVIDTRLGDVFHASRQSCIAK